MSEIEQETPEQAAEVAFVRVLQTADKLSAAVEALDAAGGSALLSRISAGWRPRRRERALVGLLAAKEALAEVVVVFDGRRAVPVRRSRDRALAGASHSDAKPDYL